MRKKSIFAGIGVILLAAAIGTGSWYYITQKKASNHSDLDKVYVESVSSLMKQNMGYANRFAGMVEPQESWDVNLDTSRTVKDVYVKLGDTVNEGDKLFSYDTSDLDLQLQQDQLDLESIANQMDTYNQQITTLTAERDKATTDDAKFDYTTQIQTVQMNLKQQQYDQSSKNADIKKIKKQIADSVIKSKIAGVIKTMNSTSTDPNGNTQAYITILATGDYQVKGMVNEQNIGQLSEGENVLVHSRVDDATMWKGTITKIDTQNAQSSSNNDSGMMSSGTSGTESMAQALEYPFYVNLETTDGLLLGQHVYIEPDVGQETVKEGTWLFSSYIVKEKEKAYVWADDGKKHLIKKYIKLGEYDTNMDEYEIKSGLKETDEIAYPIPNLYEGVKTVTDEAAVDYTSPLYTQGGTESTEYNGMPMEGTEGMIQETEAMPQGTEGMIPKSDTDTKDFTNQTTVLPSSGGKK